ncbi:MAG: hypothetical protein ACRDWE_00350, partial [Acidimicrobiales bacterium]
MPIARVAVFIDFDGTITTADTGVHLLDRLAPARWKRIEREYKSGRIGSRECMERQWALLATDRAAIEATVREVPILTNGIDWETNTVTFTPSSGLCPCSQCGTCKRTPLQRANARGMRIVLVGDGTSDVRAAEIADLVFAKAELARWCEASGVRFTRWSNLADVRALLANVLTASDCYAPLSGRIAAPSNDALTGPTPNVDHSTVMTTSPGGGRGITQSQRVS